MLAHAEPQRRQGYQAMLADPERKAAMLRGLAQRWVTWTPEMNTALRRLRAERASIDECAARIGVNKCVVVKQLDVLGLPRRAR